MGDGECERKGIRKPAYFDKWVNLKDLYADFYKVKRCKIKRMLELQGMQPEGRLHSGIDDTRNIARIAMQMARDGCRMYPMRRCLRAGRPATCRHSLHRSSPSGVRPGVPSS